MPPSYNFDYKAVIMEVVEQNNNFIFVAEIVGKPIAWKRPMHNSYGVLYSPHAQQTEEFRQHIASMRPPTVWQGPVYLQIRFVFERPRAHFSRGHLRVMSGKEMCTEPAPSTQ